MGQPRQSLELARASAKRAMELDPGFAEAHLALGDVRRMLEWDWRGRGARLCPGDCAQSPLHALIDLLGL
jgi:hypothetical protein